MDEGPKTAEDAVPFTAWEYAMITVKGEASDAGLLAGLIDAGKLGWEVVTIRIDGKPELKLQGLTQRWTFICKRPKRAIQPATSAELEGLTEAATTALKLTS